MPPPTHHVRRATVDDLPPLIALWRVAGLPVLELERRLTEFQIVVRSDGPLIGALGLRVQGHYGLLHSEAFFHPETEDEFRPHLWERLRSVARNHGLTRLWTEEDAVFWHQTGFEPPTKEQLERLPKEFGDAHSPHWHTLQLRDEAALTRSLEQEFELFRVTQEEQSEKVMRQARVLKLVATVLALVLFAVVMFGFYYLFRQNRLTLHR